MPFLVRTKSINVLTVMKSETDAMNCRRDMAHRLARHNLKVDFKRIVANDQDIGNAILRLRRTSIPT